MFFDMVEGTVLYFGHEYYRVINKIEHHYAAHADIYKYHIDIRVLLRNTRFSLSPSTSCHSADIK